MNNVVAVWYSNSAGGYSHAICRDCAVASLPTPESDIELIREYNQPCEICGVK